LEPDSDLVGEAEAADRALLQAAADLDREFGLDPVRGTVRELRWETAQLRLLFTDSGPDSVAMVVVGIDQDDWQEWYEEALPLIRAELALLPIERTSHSLDEFLAEDLPRQ
jgi:hypothetical protein